MFIEIGDSIGRYLQRDNGNQKIYDEIASILGYAYSSAREGTHCVKTATRECAKNIVDYLQQEKSSQKKFFYYIHSKFSTYLSGLKDQLNSYIVIEVAENEIEKVGKKIIVNTEFASRIQFWNPPCFLPENIVDRRYFLRIAYYEKLKNANLNHVDYSLTPEQGAGGRSVDTYICRCSEKKFILAVLDNDRTYPTQGFIPGSNAEKFISLNDDDYPTGAKIVLNVHEIENLFSSDTFINHANAENAASFLSYNLSPEVRQFYDFKNGFALNRLSRNAYMTLHLRNAGVPIRACENLADCVQNQPYRNCGCSVVAGMGKLFLKDIFGDSENESNEYIKAAVVTEFNGPLMGGPEGLIEPIKQEWVKIYNAFLTWFCSYKQEIYV